MAEKEVKIALATGADVDALKKIQEDFREDLTEQSEEIAQLKTAQGGVKWTVENGILYAEYEEV